MAPAAFLPWALLAWLFGKVSTKPAPAAPGVPAPPPPTPAPAPAPPTVVQTPTGTVPAVYKPTPEPWPQAVPAGLPAFPGASWVPDNPPGAGVVARATQLIPTLWAHGAGTFKTEQTAGRWITYRATPMGAKKGVVAFKLIAEPSVKVTPEPDLVPPPSTPAYQTASYPTPAAAPASSPVALPTLRLTSPRTQGASVKTLQQRLGIPDDGVFGSGTFAAVKSFQTSRGLSPDGVVGPKTWASLFGRTA